MSILLDQGRMQDILQKHDRWLRGEDGGERAILRGANLAYVNLTGANLKDANLTRANLTGANLKDANLTRANLTSANLTGANLTGANLAFANLKGSRLKYADLAAIKNDVWAVLVHAIGEIDDLIAAIKGGRVDGSSYEGACACLIGTIAHARGVHYSELPGIRPDSSRPAERWFTGIKAGDTPENNVLAAIALEWIEEFRNCVRGASS